MTRPTDAGPERRSVLLLGAGAGALLLSGCALNNPFRTEQTQAAQAARDLAPDVGVAVEAVAQLNAAKTELETLIATNPALAPRLAGLFSSYQAYVTALLGAVPKGVDVTSTPPPTGAPVGPTPTPAGAKLTARNTASALHARLRGFALRAESGPFARLLGSMSAGLSQQLVVLDR